MKTAIISLFIFIFFQTTAAGTLESITLRWDWNSSASGLTAGPNRDVAFALYLRTEYDPDYAYDYPLISGIDNCWWNIDQYTCEVTIDHEFESAVNHYFVVVAYKVETPNQKSAHSNEVEYCSDCAYQSSGTNGSPGGNSGSSPQGSSGGSSGGGGCFISVSKD
jgi:uncharacterized membrane protein YgcG